MLSRLRKNKHRLQHDDPAVRRRAVEALDADKVQELQDQLAALAASDPDTAVRGACIARLDNPEALAPLLETPSIAQQAAQRIAALLAAGQSQSPLLRHPLVVRELPAASALQLIERIDEEDGLLIELCLSNRGALRTAALARITSAKALTQLERHSRDHDKTLNRHARANLERIREARQAANAARARLEELLDALERAEPGTPQRRAALHRELQTTRTSLLTQQDLLRGAGESVDEVGALEQRIAALPPPDAAANSPTAAAPAEPAGPSPFINLVEQYRALHNAMAQGEDLPPIAAQHQALNDAWVSAAEERQPTSEQQQVFETVSHAYQQYATTLGRIAAVQVANFARLPQPLPTEADALRDIWRELGPRRKALRQLQTQLGKIRWPDWSKPERGYRELQQHAAQQEEDVRRLQEHETHITEELEALTNVLAAAVEAGATNKGADALTKARRLSRMLPPRSAERLLARLNSEAAKFAELRDWQTFATSPKRQALCDKMRQLVEQPLDPRDQADRIKQLRGEWNELGPPGKQHDRKLAEEFNRLAEAAFEPCRSYFAEQAEVRKANLEQRKTICEQLRDYLASTDWPTADMKAAEQILRTARSEWRRFHPVDRNPGKQLDTEFETLQGQLHQRIKDAGAANLELKQGIVDEAEALIGEDKPIEEKIARAKALQQQWKQVGITPRSPDQRLWQAFRQACDSVFAQREAEREHADQSLRQALEQTSNLIAEIRAEVDATTVDNAQRGYIRDARSRFAELPQTPQRAFAEAQRELDALIERYTRLLDQRAAQERLNQLRQLQAWDVSTTEFESARAAGSTESYAAPAPCFADRLADGATPAPLELLREHTVTAELLAGLESPAGDRQLRLKIQVDQLNSGMGKRATPPDPLALAEAWCALGPKCWGRDEPQLDDDCSTLRERVFQALEKLLAR
jgi:hypothetical protein